LGSGGVPTWTGEGLLEVTLPNDEILYIHPTDNSTAIVWGDDNVDISGVVNQSAYNDFNGAANTQAIVAELGDFNNGAYAARLCADLVAFGFDDWYLPALGELHTMYQQLGPVSNGGSGEITDGFYWSSSEDASALSYNMSFDNGELFIINKFLFSDRCRCVRR
jgi:hypothetical protein